MPDVLPFLNEREVLTFRWTANTPRSSLRQPSKTTEELLQQVNSSGSSSSGSYDRIARGVRWDASVLSKEEKSNHTNKNTDNLGSNIGSARPYRYSAAARAEHSRRVLNEQEQQRKKAVAGIASDQKDSTNDDPFKLDKTSEKEPDTSPQTAQHDQTGAADLEQTSKNADVTSPPFSRDRNQSDEDQINSSPIASPTRNIRSAQKSNKEWMVPLGSDKSEEGTPKQDQSPVQLKEVDSAEAVTTSDKMDEQTKSKEEPSNDDITSAHDLDKSVPSQKKSRIHDSYQRMVSIVDALRGHPSNTFFRQSIEYDDTYIPFVHFLRQQNRPILDFHVLGEKLNEQKYGEENVYAAFASDLSDMWCNIRGFFGPSSPQGQCADFLERFSRIIMVEWRREGGKSEGKGRISPASKDALPTSDGSSKAEAMARAARMLHNMAYGNMTKPNPSIPLLKRKASGSKASEVGSKSRFNTASTRSPTTVQEKKDEISPPSKFPRQKGTGSTMPQGSQYNPSTQAFLASLFPKAPHARHVPVGNRTAMKSLQRKASEQSVAANAAAQRASISPKVQVVQSERSPKSKKSARNETLSPRALKRTEPPIENEEMEHRPAKRANTEISSPVSFDQLPVLTVSDETSAAKVPRVLQSPTKTSVPSKNVSSPSKEEEVAIEHALKTVGQVQTKENGKRTPPSSVKKNVKQVSPSRASPRHNKVEAIKNSEPRRTSRQSTPTLKARIANSQSPTKRSPENKTPQKEPEPEIKRMATRSTPIGTVPTKGAVRQRRKTTTA